MKRDQINRRCRFRWSLFSLSAALFFVALFADEAASNELQTAPLRGVDTLSVEQRRAFLRGSLSDWRLDTDSYRGVKPPSIQKSYPADATRIKLVAPDNLNIHTTDVKQAIGSRRSRRSFSGQMLTLKELSYLLWATQGISKTAKDENNQIVAHYRTVPSGGGRHPFETYLIVNRVQDVAPGLYRYLAVEHQLLLILQDARIGDRLNAACYAQNFIGDSSVTFVWTAVPYRTEWKYGSIAQKLVAIEAGHICQNLYLAAESVRLGVCASLGYNQELLDKLLGVDGKDEFAIYLAAVGKPQ